MSQALAILDQTYCAANTASAARIDLPTAGDTIRISVVEAASVLGAYVKLGTKDVTAAAGTAATAAAATLTSTGTFSAGEQAIIGSRTYTFVAALTVPAVPGEVLIGANQTASHLNLLRAINGGSGAGSLYATGTAPHELVTAASSDGTHTVLAAKIPGAAANSIGTTEGAAAAAMANASWGATTMASGADGVESSTWVSVREALTVKKGGATSISCIGIGANTTVCITALG